MTPLKEEALNFYKNIRFVHGGNDLHQADCFGIIRLVNQREYGIDIGDYVRSNPMIACRSIDSFYKKIVEDKLWIPIEKPYTGCTVVLSNSMVNGEYLADHVGIYIEPNKILSTTLLERFSSIQEIKAQKILGFYEFNTNREE